MNEPFRPFRRARFSISWMLTCAWTRRGNIRRRIIAYHWVSVATGWYQSVTKETLQARRLSSMADAVWTRITEDAIPAPADKRFPAWISGELQRPEPSPVMFVACQQLITGRCCQIISRWGPLRGRIFNEACGDWLWCSLRDWRYYLTSDGHVRADEAVAGTGLTGLWRWCGGAETMNRIFFFRTRGNETVWNQMSDWMSFK